MYQLNSIKSVENRSLLVDNRFKSTDKLIKNQLYNLYYDLKSIEADTNLVEEEKVFLNSLTEIQQVSGQ